MLLFHLHHLRKDESLHSGYLNRQSAILSVLGNQVGCLVDVLYEYHQRGAGGYSREDRSFSSTSRRDHEEKEEREKEKRGGGRNSSLSTEQIHLPCDTLMGREWGEG